MSKRSETDSVHHRRKPMPLSTPRLNVVSGVVRWFQSGYLYHYALVMILGILVLMTYFVWMAK